MTDYTQRKERIVNRKKELEEKKQIAHASIEANKNNEELVAKLSDEIIGYDAGIQSYEELIEQYEKMESSSFLSSPGQTKSINRARYLTP